MMRLTREAIDLDQDRLVDAAFSKLMDGLTVDDLTASAGSLLGTWRRAVDRGDITEHYDDVGEWLDDYATGVVTDVIVRRRDADPDFAEAYGMLGDDAMADLEARVLDVLDGHADELGEVLVGVWSGGVVEPIPNDGL